MHNREREDLFGKQDRKQSETDDSRRPSDEFEGSTGNISEDEQDMERSGREIDVEHEIDVERIKRETMTGRDLSVEH